MPKVIVSSHGGDPVIGLHTDLCFASWFYNYRTPNSDFLSYFPSLYNGSKDNADWFLNEFILPMIPDRCKEAITIKEVSKEVLETTHRIVDPYFKPWIEVAFERSKILSEDLYIAATLFRMPQDYNNLIEYMRKLMDTDGVPLETAFLLTLLTQYGDHHLTFASNYFNGFDPTPQQIKEWSFKNKWLECKTIPLHEQPHSKRKDKTQDIGYGFNFIGKKPANRNGFGMEPLFPVYFTKWKEANEHS